MFNYYNEFEKGMNRFNFKKVHKVMKFLDWKWGEDIPTIDEMKETCQELFEICLGQYLTKKEVMYAGTGGFEIWIGKDFVNIRFALEWYDSYL